MAVVTTQGVPKFITAGDAITFEIADADFPAGTWTSKVVFKDEAGAVLSFAGVQSGTSHVFTLTNANTATLVAGQNFVCLQFSDGTNRKTRIWGDVAVLSDPFTASALTFAQAQVTLLQTVIAAFNTSSATSVNFNGQSFTRSGLKEYQDQFTYWQARVIQERKKARALRGLPNYRIAAPRFINDGNQGVFPASTVVQ